MAGAPIVIHLYNDDSEVIATYSRGFVPWGILESALELQGLDQSNLTKEDVERINSLVIEFFGNQFTADDLRHHAEFSETYAVLTAILSKVTQNIENPTHPGKLPRSPKKTR